MNDRPKRGDRNARKSKRKLRCTPAQLRRDVEKVLKRRAFLSHDIDCECGGCTEFAKEKAYHRQLVGYLQRPEIAESKRRLGFKSQLDDLPTVDELNQWLQALESEDD